jgi:tetratricopeptide (TPR) repeat protein
MPYDTFIERQQGAVMNRMISALLVCFLVSLGYAQEKSQEDLQKEALALNSIRSEESMTKKIKELGEDKKHARKLVQAAAALLPKKEETTFTYSGANILASLASDVRETKTAIEFYLIAVEKANKIKSVRKLCMSRFYLIGAYLADNRAADAEKVAQKIISYNPGNIELEDEDRNIILNIKFFTQVEMVRIYMPQGKFDEAQKQLEMLEKINEQSNEALKRYVVSAQAQYHTYRGNLKDAIKLYENLVDIVDDEADKERYREVIGNLEADAGNVDKAYEIMSELLKKKPDSPGINNDLGYILATHDKKLDEAEKMIRKAVEAEPENSSYLDSMAWVLYKKKQYKEAKEYMMKAVAQERGKNTELMEHLGDIHIALGEKDEAKKAYEASLAAVTPNYKDQQRKKEVEKKLKDLK